MKNHSAAIKLADEALQNALDKIDELEEDDFRDAKSIIELLKENLTLWKEEEDDDNAIDDLWISNLTVMGSETCALFAKMCGIAFTCNTIINISIIVSEFVFIHGFISFLIPIYKHSFILSQISVYQKFI